jgi:autotransporter translocation and assembly factor TamB
MTLEETKTSNKTKRIWKRIFKILLGTVLAMLLLFLLVIGLIQFPGIQNYIKNKVVTSLSKKLHSRVELGYIRINFGGKLVLEDVFVADRQNDTVVYAGKIKVGFNPAGLLHRKLLFTNVSLSDVKFNYQVLDNSGKSNLDFIIHAFAGDEKDEKTPSGEPWNIKLNSVDVDNTAFLFDNLADSMRFKIRIGTLHVGLQDSRIDSMRFNVDKIDLADTRASLLTYALAKKEVSPSGTADTMVNQDTAKSILFTLKSLNLKNVSFQQNDSLSGAMGNYFISEAQVIPSTIDLSKQIISLRKLVLSHGNILYKQGRADSAESAANAADETVKSGTAWKVSLDDGNISLDKLQLVGLMPDTGAVKYLSNISLANIRMNFNASTGENNSWSADIKTLKLEDERTSRLISVTADAASDGSVIRANSFRVQLGSTFMAGNARINIAAANPEQVPEMDGSIVSSRIRMTDLVPYLPSSLLTNLNRVPSEMFLSATVNSRNQIISGHGELRTSEGNVSFQGELNQANPKIPAYTVNVGLNDLNAGFFAQNQQLGQLTASINAQGSGFSPDSMKTAFALDIPNVNYSGFTYHNTSLNGNINFGKVNFTLITREPVASLTAKVDGTLGNNMAFHINSRISNLDLHATGLMKDTLAFSALIDAHYNGKDSLHMNATTDTLLVTIRTPRDEIKTNSRIKYYVSGDTVETTVASNFGDISYKGNLPLQNVSDALKNYFARYFEKNFTDSLSLRDKYFDMSMNIKDLSILHDLMAVNVSIPEKASIKASLKNNRLTANVDFKKILYNDMTIDGLTLDASSRDSAFQIAFNTKAFHTQSQSVKDIDLKSELRQGNLDTRLSLADVKSKKWFNIGFTMQPQNPELNMVLQEPLMLDYREWAVDKNNLTFIRNNNVVFNDLKLTQGNRLISLLSDAKRPEKLAVSFRNLGLGLISEIMEGDSAFMKGNINGDVMITNLMAKPLPTFDVKIKVDSIDLQGQKLGDLNVMADNLENNDIAGLNISLGKENMLFNLKGSYGLKPEIPMDLNLTTNNFNLPAIEPLITDFLTGTSGALNASVNLKGTFADPQVTGSISFDKVSAYVVSAQTRFGLDQQKIVFRGNQVVFNKFTVKDVDGHTLSIHGNIGLADMKNLRYDMRIQSDKFLAYKGNPGNLPGQDNKVVVTSDINVTGENSVPVVRATIRIDEGSRFFYKITKQASTLTEDGVIEFIGPKLQAKEVASQPTSIMENLSLTANITLAENTNVTLITDPLRNLGLNMKAGGKFTMAQRPFQSPELTGRLDISGGSYAISFSGIKRKFEIADSSYIVWYGDLTQPELNLRAYYQVRTSPDELLGQSSTDASSTLPFMVYMYISGSLAEPSFNFKLSLPREYEGVNNGLVAAKLEEINSNESELNQKAMTLLLFGSFGFNNLTGVLTSGQGGRNAIISNALNQIASQKLKFVDLHFDLESYDNYGSETNDNLRTEMEIAATRKFLDNRLGVQLGTTVVLQADESEQQKSLAERFSPEFNVDYKLNKPRTLSIETFRKSEYRGLMEGKVINTGIGVVYQKNFNKFSDLFGKKPDELKPVAEKETNGDE